jgi:hypothetical protein
LEVIDLRISSIFNEERRFKLMLTFYLLATLSAAMGGKSLEIILLTDSSRLDAILLRL